MSMETQTDPSRESCSVLVCSCDSYADLWRPFFTLFFRHWPNCPYQVFLGSETKVLAHERVVTLLSGGEHNWSNCLLKYLEQIKTPYVLIFLEDFFLREDVDTEKVAEVFSCFVKLKGKLMRIGRNKPWPSRGINEAFRHNPDIAAIKPGFPCRITLQVSFWEKQALIDLCRPDESIWQFETNGSTRSWKWENGFYCTMEPIMPYRHHVVEKGRWFRRDAKYFSAFNIGCDFSKRPLMTRSETAKWILCKTKSFIIRRMTPNLWKSLFRGVADRIRKSKVMV